MELTLQEHYLASFLYLVGGALSVVGHLWLLLEFLSVVDIPKATRRFHQSLAYGNLLVVAGFFIGMVTHFERKWIFGATVCTAYTFWSKFSVISACSNMAACLWGEYQRCFYPDVERSERSYKLPITLAWLNGLFWGFASITWATYGVETVGYTCSVHWAVINSYSLCMVFIGSGVPMSIAYYLAYQLWSHEKTKYDAFAKIAACVCITLTLQISGYVIGYICVLMGIAIPVYALAAIPVFIKCGGIMHPFVYSRVVYSHYLQSKNR